MRNFKDIKVRCSVIDFDEDEYRQIISKDKRKIGFAALGGSRLKLVFFHILCFAFSVRLEFNRMGSWFEE